MLDLDGLELATTIRAVRPILLLTGLIDELDGAVARCADVTELVQKPMTYEELTAVVAATPGGPEEG